jgi:hypothetical protein
VQVCVQCGLSIGESAAFCPVCGTRRGDGVAVATAVEPGAPLAPVLGPEAGASFGPEAREFETPGTGTETPPGREPATGLVTELEPDHEHEPDAEPEVDPEMDPEAVRLDAGPVTGHGAIREAQPEVHAELVADLASEHRDEVSAEAEAAVEAETDVTAEATAEATAEDQTEAEAALQPEELEAPAEPEESPDDVRERRMVEIAALLEFGGRCEEANPARAAVVYGEVVVACLEITDDPLGIEPVRRDLLRGFDRLSFVLERQGLPEEALAVVDDAASLGLLDGEDGVAAPQRGALRDRREGLRRILYGDWAQL